ncbi:udp-n-acetyl-d-galactosamine:polypeptide n-acetylgalactosaminyltransferase t1 [Cystoisospora suis]|uniref:Udp-n-acetyl-d-galactosamine:polypeptide n-acetylgalactosaminyltransferase t1 n=1 Tax=Cystoisospora suis TaxID=483139 RepID=A0A2C6L955_9APIC|nr:udp-n-acetyl-d-galactosamine:polypeptide n-acetylgalactosaminyltransferase t1 [Cystoisospora suis]
MMHESSDSVSGKVKPRSMSRLSSSPRAILRSLFNSSSSFSSPSHPGSFSCSLSCCTCATLLTAATLSVFTLIFVFSPPLLINISTLPGAWTSRANQQLEGAKPGSSGVSTGEEGKGSLLSFGGGLVSERVAKTLGLSPLILGFPPLKRRPRQIAQIGKEDGKYGDRPAIIIEPELVEGVNPGADEDRLHGIVGMYDDGRPAWTPSPVFFKMNKEQKREAHKGYCFNTRASDSISLDRATPDFASYYCRKQRPLFDSLTPQLPDSSPFIPSSIEGKDHEEKEEENSSPMGDTQQGASSESFMESSQAEGKKYLPNTSVVIVFYNENLSVLLRSIHSVLNHTPPSLLREIIVVDDFSDKTTHPWLGDELENYIAETLPKTRLLRLLQRRGLMGARMAGAAIAGASTITFLDSHIECMRYWLQPLLYHVSQDWRNVAMPEISSIHFDTFRITEGGLSTLAFTWGMAHHHIHEKIRHRIESTAEGKGVHAKEKDAPMMSPIMAGGLFTISRKWWNTLGGYDKEMQIYGGEEFELSFKIWMCGGSLHLIPCSKVGHVFRHSEFWQGQVYPVAGEVIHRNKLRAAHVWMEDYVKIVELVVPKLPEGKTIGDLTEQRALRDRLKCKNFDWYLQNIYPELKPPVVKDALTGAVKNLKYSACLDTLTTHYEFIGAYPCHYEHGTQAFLYDRRNHRLLVAEHNFEDCVFGSPALTHLPERRCQVEEEEESSNSSPDEFLSPYWLYDERSKQFQLMSKKGDRVHVPHLCMETVQVETPKSPYDLILRPCDPSKPHQKFVFVP